MAQIVVHGRLARDPELREATVGSETKSICEFTVAESKRFGEGANFFNCKLWGKRGEAIQKFMSKGSEIVVYGEMEQNPYTNKEGKKVSPWNLNVNNFDFCGSKKDGADKPKDPNVPEGFVPLEDDDDIPF